MAKSCGNPNCTCLDCHCGPSCRCTAATLKSAVNCISSSVIAPSDLVNSSTAVQTVTVGVSGMTCSNCSSGVQRAIESLSKGFTTSPVLSVEVSLVLNRATVVLALPCDGDDNVAIDVIDEGQVYEGEEKETQSLLGVGKRGKRKVSVGEGEHFLTSYTPIVFLFRSSTATTLLIS